MFSALVHSNANRGLCTRRFVCIQFLCSIHVLDCILFALKLLACLQASVVSSSDAPCQHGTVKDMSVIFDRGGWVVSRVLVVEVLQR